MYDDAFDQFVFDDAVERRSMSIRHARARVDYHGSWIHHAILRLRYAENAAELRAARLEVEQDIRHIQARHGWDQQLMTAFHARWEAAQVPFWKARSAAIPKHDAKLIPYTPN